MFVLIKESGSLGEPPCSLGGVLGRERTPWYLQEVAARYRRTLQEVAARYRRTLQEVAARHRMSRNGAKDFLDHLHCARPRRGFSVAPLVGALCDHPDCGVELVGCISERVVQLSSIALWMPET